MSTFGTTDNVSGHIDLAEINKRNEAEIKSLSKNKGIKRPTFEWNDNSYQSFKETVATGVPMNGKESSYNGWDFARSVMSNKGMVGREKPGFMERCDLNQGPVKHIIYNMKRLKAREYDEKFEPGKIKEYITYEMRHEGKDFLGRKIASPQITEGVYQQYTTRTEVLAFDSRTGEPRAETRLGDPIIVHYIPWEGKKTLEKIFKKYPGSEDSLENTMFYAQYGDGARGGSKERNNLYTYEQFVNSEFEHLEWLGRRVGGPTGRNNLGRIDPDQAIHGPCQCSNCKKRAKNTSVQ